MQVPAPKLPPQPAFNQDCRRIGEILSRIGDKWTVLVVMMLREQPLRFNELKRAIGGISQQMLTRTLKGLERDGMIRRTVRPTVPPQVEYSLAPLGYSLSEPVIQLGGWARAHVDEIDANRALYDGLPSALDTIIRQAA